MQIGNNTLQNSLNSTNLPNSYLSDNSTKTSPKNESLNLSALGADIFNIINNEREKEGAGQLTWDDSIAAVAGIYSNNTLIYNKSTYVKDALNYSAVKIVTYNFYIYENCTFNSTGSLMYCTYVEHDIALSRINNFLFNRRDIKQDLTLKKFTDMGIGVIANGSEAYITIILTDYQNWKEKDKLSRIANLIHQKVNYERTSRGLNSLNWNEKLAGIAIMHNQDMIQYNFFGHEGPNFEPFNARFNSAGIFGVGENIYECGAYSTCTTTCYNGNCGKACNWYSDEQLAENAVDGWMNSLGHRDNILNPVWNEEGIGVSRYGDYYYFTQDFT